MARKAKVDNAVLKRLKRTEKKRKEAIKSIRQFVLIVCEGEKTEPAYFNGYKQDLPRGVLDNNKIEVHGEGKNTMSLIHEVKKIRQRREKETGRYFDQTWIVFDRDSFPADQFNNSIFAGRKSEPPILSAWSNEAFELWYCLHFCYVNHAMPRQDYRHRIETELSKAIGQPFVYKKNDPKMYQTMKRYGNQDQAITWAKRLESLFEGREDFANHNPCTKIHHLIEALNDLK